MKPKDYLNLDSLFFNGIRLLQDCSFNLCFLSHKLCLSVNANKPLGFRRYKNFQALRIEDVIKLIFRNERK